MKFVFRLLSQPTTESNLDLEDEYVGTYQNNNITRDLVVKIENNTTMTLNQEFIVPTYKVEKLYQWK